MSDGVVSFYLALFELGLFVITFSLKKKHPSVALAAMMILFLAGYQFCEALICRFGFTGQFMSYLAIADISFLPPLTLIFSLRFWGNKSSLPRIAFVAPLFFVVFYGINMNQMHAAGCTPFYAMYSYPLGDVYGVFYYAPILISMVLFAVNIRKTRNTAQRRFAAVILGSFVFISLPVIIAFAAKAAGNATLLKAVESIMCKAAGVLAVAVTYVAFHMQQVPAPTPGFFADHSSR